MMNNTAKLYKLLNDKNKNVTLDEVKFVLSQGVVKKGVKCCDGGLLFNCVANFCHPDILQLLVDYGIEDEKTVVSKEIDIPLSVLRTYIHEEYLVYATCMNYLVYTYHKIIGSSKIIIQILNKISEINQKQIYPMNAIEYISHNNIFPLSNPEECLKRIKVYCKILQIDFDSLEDGELEFPDNMNDWSIIPDWDWDLEE